MPGQTWELVSRIFRRRTQADDERRKQERALSKEIRQILQKEYDGMGPVTFHQVSVFFLFLLLVVLWCSRDPGWASGIKVR